MQEQTGTARSDRRLGRSTSLTFSLSAVRTEVHQVKARQLQGSGCHLIDLTHPPKTYPSLQKVPSTPSYECLVALRQIPIFNGDFEIKISCNLPLIRQRQGSIALCGSSGISNVHGLMLTNYRTKNYHRTGRLSFSLVGAPGAQGPVTKSLNRYIERQPQISDLHAMLGSLCFAFRKG
jgi:hypothetical protein